MKTIDTLVKVFILLILLPIFITSIPTGPLHIMTVSGNSMEPVITANDIVVIIPAITQPAVGDIITYRPHFQSDEGASITHRVVGVVEEGNITKGDANELPDGNVAPGDVIGIMVFKIPFIGALVHFARTPVGFLTVVLFPSIILIIIEIREIIRLL